MSNQYFVKEHLVIKDNVNEEFLFTAKLHVAETMNNQLAILGALMLRNLVDHCKISLTTDEETIKFEGICPDETFKKIINGVSSSKNVDLVSEYHFTYGVDGLSQDAGPFRIKELLEDVDNTDYFSDDGENLENLEAKLDGIFYSAWYRVDDETEEGTLYACGMYDGKLYNNEIGYEETDTIPEGNWSAGTAILVEADTKAASFDSLKGNVSEEHLKSMEEYANKIVVAPDQIKQVESICRELVKLTRDENDYELRVSDQSIEFNLFSVQLKNTQDMNTYFSLNRQLRSINENIAWSDGYFFDATEDNVKQMRIYMDDIDSPRFEVSEIK